MERASIELDAATRGWLEHALKLLEYYQQMSARGWRHRALDAALLARGRSRLTTTLADADGAAVTFASDDGPLLAATAAMFRALEPQGLTETVAALRAVAALLPAPPASLVWAAVRQWAGERTVGPP